MNTAKSFYKEILARIKGDDAEVKAQKVARKAHSAIKSQVSALEAKEVDDEAAVEAAQEALAQAKYPTEVPLDNKAYVAGIQKAYDNLTKTEETLENTRDSIRYFQQVLTEFDKVAA